MRKSLILMLIATLLVGAFLVSCNSDITSESSNGDKLVKVTIAGNSKGISAIAGGDDADNYFWYYKASKNDTSVYRTGQTVERAGEGTTESPYTNGAGGWTPVKKDSNGAIAGLSGADLGYFSTGDWLFSFAGFTEKVSFEGDTATGSTSQTVVTSAYNQSNLSVGVTAETHITVTLTAGSGLSGKATLVFAEGLDWVYTPEEKTNAAATLAALSGKSAYMLVYTSKATDATPIAQSVPVEVALDDNNNPTKASVTFASFAPYGEAAPTASAPVTVDASVAGTDYTFYFKVFVNNGTTYEEVGKTNTQSAKAYSNGTIAITKTGDAAVGDNESIEKVYIDGSYLPEIGAYSAKGSEQISNNASIVPAVTFETTITAVSTEVTTVNNSQTTAKTTVSFPESSFTVTENSTDRSIEMEVVVYQTEVAAAANSTFVVAEGSSAFAGLSLDVTLIETVNEETTETKVDQFNGKEVTIVTYIAKGLTNVNVANMSGQFVVANSVVYDAETGRLEFKTTHFSDFAVGADQNVYDKTSNTGYRIGTNADGEAKEGLLLDANNAVVEANNDHEYLLLDATKANDVADSIDAFNSYINWSVVHPASDTPNTGDFDGGYGTKVEPYLIADVDSLRKIGSGSYYSEYKYYKIKEANSEFDCSNWTQVNLNGSFDGNGLSITAINATLFGNLVKATKATVIKNTTINCDITSNYHRGAVVHYALNSVTFDNITVHGKVTAAVPASFVSYGNRENDYEFSIVFENCLSDATLVVTSECAGGFIAHPYVKNHKLNLYIIDSKYCGTMVVSSSDKAHYFYGNDTGLIDVFYKYSDNYDVSDLIIYTANWQNGCTQTDDGFTKFNPDGITEACYVKLNPAYVSTQAITRNTYNLDNLTYGDSYSVSANANAVKATVNFIIGGNDPNGYGNYTGVYVSDTNLSPVNGVFTTNNVKYCQVTINGNATTQSGYNDGKTIYNVVNSYYGNTYGSAFVQILQYNSENALVEVDTFRLN